MEGSATAGFRQESVAAGVDRFFLADNHPMHSGGVAIYAVGSPAAALIDTGTGNPAHIEQAFAVLASQRRQVAAIMLTHTHRDHVSGLRQAVAAAGAPVMVHPGGLERAREECPEADIRPLDDNQVIEAGGGTLTCIYTPGHSPDSVSFHDPERRILFTGDTILGATSTSVREVKPYLDSLARLAAIPAPILCPGHGPVVRNARRKIADSIQHRLEREAQVLAALAEPRTSAELTGTIYGRLHEGLRYAAQRNVDAHLHKLMEEGQVAMVGERSGEPLYGKVDGHAG